MPIESMIQAQLGLSREESIAQNVALQRAQEARLNTLTPLQAEQLRQSALTSASARAVEEARLKQFNNMTDLEKQTALAQLQGIQTRTEAQRAATEQAGALAPLEVAKAQQDITRSKVLTEDVIKAREQAQGQLIPFKFPDGTEALVPASQVQEQIVRGGVVDQEKLFRMRDTLQQRERQAAIDEQKQRDEAQAAEATILGKDTKGVPNIHNPAVVTSVDEFNRKSEAPYFYKYVPPTPGLPNVLGGGPSQVKIPLADKSGRPLQARAVYQKWLDYQQQTKRQISLEDFVNTIIKGGK